MRTFANRLPNRRAYPPRSFFLAVAAAILSWAAAGTLHAADPPDAKPGKSEKSPPAKAPNAHTVAAEPLSVVVEMGATVEARDVKEVSIVPEQWSDLIVAEAVDHGARVQSGGVLVKFDTRRIDQTIRDLETESRLNELALKQVREGLALLKQSVPLQLAEAQRAALQASEDLKEFAEKGRPRTLEDIDFQVKSSEQFLAYQEEELKQLEKMYKADDLMADTEEIVLKRSRFDVESAKHRLKQAQAAREWNLAYGLPRQEAAMKNAVAQTSLGLQKAQATLPQAIIEGELNLSKIEYEDGKKKQRLAELKRDRDRLTLRAPANGVVYYGRPARGVWPSEDLAGGALAVGAQVRPHQVLLCVVDPQTVRLRAAVEESQMRQLRQGMRGTFRPTLDPKRSLSATMGVISAVPIAAGRFDAEIDAEIPAGGKGLPVPLMPGMAGQARFVVYSNPKAIVVPVSAVKTDDEEQSYVTFLDADGNPQRRDVKVGEKVKDKIEIVEGLKAGDKIQVEEKK